ncbi:MAG: ATP-binding protein, partial [Spiroplasma sp.]|nr:ATP-binding protein [Mycoplasmatales bacterium]
MAAVLFWERILVSFEKENGSDVREFLFANSKFLKIDGLNLVVQVDPLSMSILGNTNSTLYISLKTIVDGFLKQDTILLFVHDAKDIDDFQVQTKEIANLNLEWSYEKTELNPSFTFDNYFYSYENRTVLESANQIIEEIISEKTTLSFNPFFIHGASGIGKTHFVNALGNEIFAKNKSVRVLYKNATEFFNEYTSLFKGGLDTKKLDVFKELYFNLDVFIIDDIQMLSTKEGSLNEFFAIFEYMRVGNKYTIITSDVRPKFLNFEDRLLTRFLSGLVMEINFPDSDTKTQIFKYHAHRFDLSINEAAIQIFINSSKNVRELLGYINSLKIDLITNNFDNFEYKESDAIEIVSKTTGIFTILTKEDI